MAVTVLVCHCGKRISAPGATPGRVGKCPACGAVLQIPSGPAPAPDAALRPADAQPWSFPPTCPACGNPLVRPDGEADTRCVAPNCPAQRDAKESAVEAPPVAV